MEIQRFFIDIATDLLAVRSGSSANAKVGPNIVLQTSVNINYHASRVYDLPVPPQQELSNELMLILSGGLLKPLHNDIIKVVAVEHAVDKSPRST